MTHTVCFKFVVGQEVTVTDAKFKAKVVGAISEEGGNSYRVMFWHDGDQRVFVVRESELS